MARPKTIDVVLDRQLRRLADDAGDISTGLIRMRDRDYERERTTAKGHSAYLRALAIDLEDITRLQARIAAMEGDIIALLRQLREEPDNG